MPGLWRRLAESRPKAVLRKVREQVPDFSTEDFGYSRLGGLQERIPETTRSKAVNLSRIAAHSNLIIRRILSIADAYVLAEGFSPKSDNPDIQAVLESFWNHPANQMNELQFRLFRKLLLDGEILLKAEVNDTSGAVTLISKDPLNIQELQFDPLYLLPTQLSFRDTPEQLEKIIQIKLDPEHPDYLKKVDLEGRYFYFRFDFPVEKHRGIPFLFPIFDWADILDEYGMTEGERAILLRTFLWDVLIQGADDREIDDFIQKYFSSPPEGPTVRGHNENVTISVISPDLKAGDFDKVVDVIISLIATGANIPKTWLNATVDVNRATARELDPPTLQFFKMLRRRFRNILSFICRYALEQFADKHPEKHFKEEDLKNFKLIGASPFRKDYEGAAKALASLSAALGQAREEGLISEEEAQEVFKDALHDFGFKQEA